MPAIFGHPNYNFYPDSDESDTSKFEDETSEASLAHMAFWYMIILVLMLLTWLVVFFCLRIIALRQKTRNPQERRGVYVGSRSRPSFAQAEPTIFVSPSNLPPPPKYEAMAPPSYEEVVGIHYPNFQIQPITQPITSALAQTSDASVTNNATTNVPCNANETPSTIITVTSDERRTSVTVATSS